MLINEIGLTASQGFQGFIVLGFILTTTVILLEVFSAMAKGK